LLSVVYTYLGTMAVTSQDEGQLQNTFDGSRASLDLGTFPRSSFQLSANTPVETDHLGLSRNSILNSVPRFGRSQGTDANVPRAASFNHLKVSSYARLVVQES
jgi:hypothetical protein